MTLELLCGLVAEELDGVTAFDQGHALGDEAFQFDRADFRAILILVAALLRQLIGVKVAVSASKMSATAPVTVRASGSGLGSGSSWKGR